MLRTILALVALSFCVFWAGATPVLNATPVAAESPTYSCKPASGWDITLQDCRAALSPPAGDAYSADHEFSRTSPERLFRLPIFRWSDSCAAIIDNTERGATVVSNYATILLAVGSVVTHCAPYGGLVDVGGLRILVLNPVTAAPGLKQYWSRCLERRFGVEVPPECTSTAQYTQLVNAARGTASEQPVTQ